ncbi:MAG: SHOCT domain-containing protein [Halorubrum sp.]
MTRPEPRNGATLDRWVSGFLGRAGVGAGVTVLVSILPVIGLLAPAIGGGVASWTDADAADRGSRVGAAAGGLVTLFSLPLTFAAVAIASTISPAATMAVLSFTLVGAVYVIGSAALGGHLVDEAMAKRASPSNADADDTPIERLKHRYVDGEIDDAEFERRLDRLVAADAEQPPEHEDRRDSPARDERRASDRTRDRRDRAPDRPVRDPEEPPRERELTNWE